MSRSRSADDGSVLVGRTAGLTAVLGVFIMASTVIFTISGFLGIHNVVVGAVTAFLAAVHAYIAAERPSPSIVLAAVLTLLGIWIAASPFVFPIFNLGTDRALVVGINSLGGALIAILSIVGIYGSVRSSNTDSAASSA